MTTAAPTTELTEEGRDFLQKRVALFAKVALVINGLGIVATVATTRPAELLKP